MGFLLSIIGFLMLTLVSWLYFVLDAKRTKAVSLFPLPFIGNALRYQGTGVDLLNALLDTNKNYGPAVIVYVLPRRYIVLAHPKYIEHMCTSNEHINKGSSYDFIQPWLGLGLLTAGGMRWRKHRKLLTPGLHFNVLQNFLPVFAKNGKVLRKKLLGLADGKPIDICPILALYALDNITESIMGVSVNSQQDSQSSYVKAIEEISQLIMLRMRNPMLWNNFVFNLLYKKRQSKALSVLHTQTRKVIESRRKELEINGITSLPSVSEQGIKSKQNFLDLLLLSKIDGMKIDDEAVREEVDTFMFEGHDTTTSGLAFCLYCISKHKDVENKILEEQKAILGDDLYKEITYSDIQQMTYLEQVIKESLRLYPSVPLIERHVARDSYLDDIFVAGNTSVIINIIQMQRNPDIFEDPLTFRPDRFKNFSDTGTFSWIPFSAGPRNCIGQKFAMMSLKVTLSGIIKNFKLVASNIEPVLCADLILRSDNGVLVGFIPRE